MHRAKDDELTSFLCDNEHRPTRTLEVSLNTETTHPMVCISCSKQKLCALFVLKRAGEREVGVTNRVFSQKYVLRILVALSLPCANISEVHV